VILSALAFVDYELQGKSSGLAGGVRCQIGREIEEAAMGRAVYNQAKATFDGLSAGSMTGCAEE